jgi:hypothetical protein
LSEQNKVNHVNGRRCTSWNEVLTSDISGTILTFRAHYLTHEQKKNNNINHAAVAG